MPSVHLVERKIEEDPAYVQGTFLRLRTSDGTCNYRRSTNLPPYTSNVLTLPTYMLLLDFAFILSPRHRNITDEAHLLLRLGFLGDIEEKRRKPALDRYIILQHVGEGVIPQSVR